MIDRVAALIVDESKWFTFSMGVALLAVVVLLYRLRSTPIPRERRIEAAMNLFFGATIGTMAFGHLLAVTTKLALGALVGSVPLFYLIGIVLAVPSWWLILHTRNVIASDDHGRTTMALNIGLAATLLVLGIPNLPLTIPAFLNIGYRLHTRRAVGWTIVWAAVLIQGGLFVGSLIFLLNGGSFEQFQGID